LRGTGVDQRARAARMEDGDFRTTLRELGFLRSVSERDEPRLRAVFEPERKKPNSRRVVRKSPSSMRAARAR
jgi:hypothetical protein